MKKYTYWADYDFRSTIAEAEDGEARIIHMNGYLSNDLSVRKAIAIAFNLDSYRK